MSWFGELVSASNDRVDIKAVTSATAFVVAVLVYAAYAIKGLFCTWDMPSNVRDLTAILVGGSVLGSASTLLNDKAGVVKPPPDEGGPLG